jgi:hypothetical protein
MRKELESVYGKWNIFVVVGDTDVPESPAYGVYISQLMQYSRARGS